MLRGNDAFFLFQPSLNKSSGSGMSGGEDAESNFTAAGIFDAGSFGIQVDLAWSNDRDLVFVWTLFNKKRPRLEFDQRLLLQNVNS